MLSKKLSTLLLLGSLVLVDAAIICGGATIVDEAGTVNTEKRATMRSSRKNRKASKSGDEQTWIDQGEVGGRRFGSRSGSCNTGNCNTCSSRSCGTCSEQAAPAAPYCKKMVEISAPAEKHRHLMYSYTCPEGFETA